MSTSYKSRKDGSMSSNNEAYGHISAIVAPFWRPRRCGAELIYATAPSVQSRWMRKLRRCRRVCLGFTSDSATCPRAWASTGPRHVGQMLGP